MVPAKYRETKACLFHRKCTERRSSSGPGSPAFNRADAGSNPARRTNLLLAKREKSAPARSARTRHFKHFRRQTPQAFVGGSSVFSIDWQTDDPEPRWAAIFGVALIAEVQ